MLLLIKAVVVEECVFCLLFCKPRILKPDAVAIAAKELMFDNLVVATSHRIYCVCA